VAKGAAFHFYIYDLYFTFDFYSLPAYMQLFETAYTAHTALTRQPENMAAEDAHLFVKVLKLDIHATTVLKLANASVLKNMILTRLPWKFHSSYSHTLPVSGFTFFKRSLLLLSPSHTIEKGIWITDQYSLAYFHWLTEALPRLIAATPFLDGHTLLLPEKYAREPFIKASLELLNCKVHFFKGSRKQTVNELVVPGHTASSGHYSIPLINEVRQRFLAATAKTPHRKIYISRQKAPRRKVMNEDTVVALVQQYGYEIHFFEDYTLQQQIAIMAETRYLVGLHGAGLTNMLFMPAQGKILELRNRQDDHNNCFFTLASALDHDYYYLNNAGDTTDTHTVNITVDTARLQQVLHRMEDA